MSYEGLFGGGGGRDGSVHGVRVGVVVDNVDPMELGRVKLTFPWRLADDVSAWARIATPMAGELAGTYFLPDVGDEVLVAFGDGDIEQPYVIGGLWNQEARPPTVNDGGNDVRMIRSRSGHAITFEDVPGEGVVEINTALGHTITLSDVEGGELISIADTEGNEITLASAEGTVSINAVEDLVLSAGNIQLAGEESVTIATEAFNVTSTEASIEAAGDVGITSAGGVEVESAGVIELEAAAELSIAAAGIVTVEGAIILLN